MELGLNPGTLIWPNKSHLSLSLNSVLWTRTVVINMRGNVWLTFTVSGDRSPRTPMHRVKLWGFKGLICFNETWFSFTETLMGIHHALFCKWPDFVLQSVDSVSTVYTKRSHSETHYCSWKKRSPVQSKSINIAKFSVPLKQQLFSWD